MIKEISAHIRDLARDTIDNGATELIIEINEEPANDLLFIIIKDNRRIFPDAESLRKPPSLAAPFFKLICDACGGSLSVEREKTASNRFAGSGGFKVSAALQYYHADRPSLGDIPSTIQELISSHSEINVYYTHRYNGRAYQLSTVKIKSILDGVPFDTPSVAHWIKENIGEGLTDIMRSEVLF
ncbi:MAG: hypothetical protein LBQ68_07710 [Clostridiales bacterium]|nr:hypothetical protein [Clostridiales bacterium]